MKVQRLSFGRTVICIGAVLLFGAAYSPLGLGIATLVGSADRTHEPGWQTGGRGVQLVLRHGADRMTHRHGAAALVLTMFAQPRQTGQTDHVLQFSSPENLLCSFQSLSPAKGSIDNDTLAKISAQMGLLDDSDSNLSPHSMADVRAVRLCARSTILLI